MAAATTTTAADTGEGVGTPLGDVRRQEHPELTGREVASLRVRVQRHSLQQCRHEGGVLAECARQAGVRVLSQCKAQKEQLNRCLAQWCVCVCVSLSLSVCVCVCVCV